MTDRFTPVMRALVAATLLLATATLMLVAVNTARAAGALAIGRCGAFGEAYDVGNINDARKSALGKCQSESYRVVAVTKRGCAAFAVDFTSACAADGWGRARALAAARTKPALLLSGGRQGVRDPHLLLRRQGLLSATPRLGARRTS